ncbi:class I SAM-dependent methyltransferase [Mesorhizobium helmanticense]|uniref:Class I SAM-dependent methyltransferase n=1 Tax=Mesorhizobium helmanticense TaxID=1776423 RepID=A0A2T4IKZ6_9HYPH|nr:class I SAM-dependent methyltransferase [Mesorhizobium helmanticense]PTE06310.1 class I SAM-dependent methyltransferase [Mesorhizobium helmanticense]
MAYQERPERERDFHNKRFGAVEERRQDSFYFAAQPATDACWQLLRETAPGKTALEYGCADGENSIRLAPFAKKITGIDISDVAIQKAKNEAARRRINNVAFQIDNAEEMSLPSATFVFGAGILHHLILDNALREIHRVMRPSGNAIFFESLGHNPLINMYRNRTPEARTIDEHPLLKSDFDIVRKHFSKCDLQFFGLSTLASIPFRRSVLGRTVRAIGKQADNVH